MTEALAADAVVVGGGNAALTAALAAAEAGARVCLLEAAPEEARGGNSAYTAGAMRVVFDNTEALRALMPDLSERELAETDFGAYREADYYDDMARLTRYRADPDLVEQLVTRSHAALCWLRGQGVRFQPSYGRQAFRQANGRFRFWGGLAVEAWGGGPGLVDALYRAAEQAGVAVHYRAPARALLVDDTGIGGVNARIEGRSVDVRAPAVVLACGGFEANAAWRARYLGPGWDLAKVRGHPLQSGRRDSHGAGSRRHAGRQLVRLPRRRLGPERAGLRRPRRGRRFPEAQLPILHRRQCRRRALRRRGRGLPQLHVCRLRPPGAGAAGPGGLAGVRRAGESPAARRVPDPAGNPGEGKHARGARRADDGYRRRASSRPSAPTTTP